MRLIEFMNIELCTEKSYEMPPAIEKGFDQKQALYGNLNEYLNYDYIVSDNNIDIHILTSKSIVLYKKDGSSNEWYASVTNSDNLYEDTKLFIDSSLEEKLQELTDGSLKITDELKKDIITTISNSHSVAEKSIYLTQFKEIINKYKSLVESDTFGVKNKQQRLKALDDLYNKIKDPVGEFYNQGAVTKSIVKSQLEEIYLKFNSDMSNVEAEQIVSDMLDNINWCLIGIFNSIDEAARRISNNSLKYMIAQFREELIKEACSKYIAKKNEHLFVIPVGLNPHYLKAFQQIIVNEKGHVLLGGMQAANDMYSANVSISEDEEQDFIQNYQKNYNSLRLVDFIINKIQKDIDALGLDQNGWINTKDEYGNNNINVITKYIGYLYDNPFSQITCNDDGDKFKLKSIEALVVNGLLNKEILKGDILVAPLGEPNIREFETPRVNGSIKQKKTYELCVASFDRGVEKKWCKLTVSDEDSQRAHRTSIKYLTPSKWITKQLEKNQLDLISENIHKFNLDEIFQALKEARLNGKYDALLTLILPSVFSEKIRNANDLSHVFELLPKTLHLKVILNASKEIIESILNGPEKPVLSFKYKSFVDVFCCWKLINRKYEDHWYAPDRLTDIAENSSDCVLSSNILELSKQRDITIDDLDHVIQLINNGSTSFSDLILKCDPNAWNNSNNAEILSLLSKEDITELVETNYDSSIEVQAFISCVLTFPNGLKVLSEIFTNQNDRINIPEILNCNVDHGLYRNLSLVQMLFCTDEGVKLLLANNGYLASLISEDTINRNYYISNKDIYVPTLRALCNRKNCIPLLDDDEGRLRRLINADTLNFISENGDRGISCAFMLATNAGIGILNADNGRLRNLINSTALNQVIEKGQCKGQTLAYRLWMSEKGREVLNADDGRLRKLVSKDALCHIMESGVNKGERLLFDLAASPEGCNFLKADNNRILNLIDENALNSITKDGNSLAYILAASIEGQEILDSENGRLRKLISSKTLGQVIKFDNSELILSAYLAAIPRGHEMLNADDGLLRKRIDSDALNYIFEGETITKGYSAAYKFSKNKQGIEILNADNGRLRRLIKKETLNHVIEGGSDKGMTLACSLSFVDKDLDVLNADNGCLRKLIDEDTLNRVFDNSALKGYSLAAKLGSMGVAGIKLLNADNGRLRKLINKESLNQIYFCGAAKGCSMLLKLCQSIDGIKLLTADNCRLLKLVDAKTFNYVKKGPLENLSPAIILALEEHGLDLLKKEHGYLAKLIDLDNRNLIEIIKRTLMIRHFGPYVLILGVGLLCWKFISRMVGASAGVLLSITNYLLSNKVGFYKVYKQSSKSLSYIEKVQKKTFKIDDNFSIDDSEVSLRNDIVDTQPATFTPGLARAQEEAVSERNEQSTLEDRIENPIQPAGIIIS